MNVEFYAKKVSYIEAIDGEIVQAIFEEGEDVGEDSFNSAKLYLLISTNYEFGSGTADAEWFDGKDNGGGVKVRSYNIDKARIIVRLENGNIFKIGHGADVSVLERVRSYLSKSCERFDA